MAVQCLFVGSSLRDLRGFPESVKDEIGHALHEAQCGLEPIKAKVLKGFGGRGVLEIVENNDGNTYRAVYTVRFADAVYVLHCFQKKVEERDRHTPARHRVDQEPAPRRGSRLAEAATRRIG